MAIELVDGRTDTASEARIVSEVLRWLVFEPEAIEHQRARTPSRRDWLGVLDGQPVGVGAAGVPVGMEASGVAVAITTLAERPELAPGIWEVACETFPDIPYGGDTPMQAGSYEQFAAGALSGPRYIPDATFAAVAGGEVVGYAQLVWMSRAAGIADHAMI